MDDNKVLSVLPVTGVVTLAEITAQLQQQQEGSSNDTQTSSPTSAPSTPSSTPKSSSTASANVSPGSPTSMTVVAALERLKRSGAVKSQQIMLSETDAITVYFRSKSGMAATQQRCQPQHALPVSKPSTKSPGPSFVSPRAKSLGGLRGQLPFVSPLRPSSRPADIPTTPVPAATPSIMTSSTSHHTAANEVHGSRTGTELGSNADEFHFSAKRPKTDKAHTEKEDKDASGASVLHDQPSALSTDHDDHPSSSPSTSTPTYTPPTTTVLSDLSSGRPSPSTPVNQRYQQPIEDTETESNISQDAATSVTNTSGMPTPAPSPALALAPSTLPTGVITAATVKECEKEMRDLREKARTLKLVKTYRSKNDLTQLQGLIDKWRSACQNMLLDLHKQIPVPTTMASLIDQCKIPYEMLNFDAENDCFN